MEELGLVDGVASLPPESWDALVGEESPFLEWAWLASLEEASAVRETTGWSSRPLVARRNGRLVAACPLYVKGHSEGEFVFDFAWADAAWRAGIEYYPKLLVGVPFTPVAGARILTATGEDRAAWIRRFAVALRELCGANDCSGVHVNFCREDERRGFEAEGYLPRLGFQYHWHNHGYPGFEGYLARLRSKRRNQIRRERREVAAQGVRVESRLGHDIPERWWDAMFRFYRATVDANPWGRPYLNRRVFELLERRFRDRTCFVMASRGEELVGGTFNVQKGDALYGRYWGASLPIRHLHFEVCYYAGIEHCIRNGLARFEPGAGGEYKQIRGFDARPTWSVHFLADERLHAAVARHLEAERAEAHQAIDWLRERSALKAGP